MGHPLSGFRNEGINYENASSSPMETWPNFNDYNATGHDMKLNAVAETVHWVTLCRYSH